MLTSLTLPIVISTALIMLNFIISQLYTTSREKPSSFECGFDAPFPARLSFSLRFFLITVIFLIFDVEITLILPTPILLSSDPSNFLSLMMTMFISILLAGLIYEWKNGALDWKL